MIYDYIFSMAIGRAVFTQKLISDFIMFLLADIRIFVMEVLDESCYLDDHSIKK